MIAAPEGAPGNPAGSPGTEMTGTSRDSSTLTQIATQVNVLPPVPAAPEVRYSLPPDAAAFTGRGEELSQITAAVTDVAVAGVVALHAIGGMPGVGKTTLAVHAAHLLRNQFPDRQLFIDLHAHTPGQEPVLPEDALAGLLTAAGVDPRHLPEDLDGRAQMWRDRIAGQRALLVFDNAASSGQVSPLLPGDGGCLVLVTSRRHLGDLPGAVMPVLLGVMPPHKAQEMFTRLAPRAANSAGEVAEVVRLAGFLPLAISLLARVFALHPSWTLADLADEIRAGVLTLTAEFSTIAAAFDVSYRHLDPVRRRFFRLLGLHPGSNTDGYAAAALAGISLEEAAGLLDSLHGEGLLTETGHRRYGMHDLLRRYARDHAAAGPATDSQRALDRLLDYYQYAATRAEDRLARQTRPGPAGVAPARPPAAPDVADVGQALAWARTDRASLLACLDHATRTSQHARVVALTAALAALLRHDGPWTDAITRHATAIQATNSLGDQPGEAIALNELGIVRRLTGDYAAAAGALEAALGICRDLGDRLGEANALNELGIVRRQTGDYAAAAGALEAALGICRDLGDRLGEANALNELGIVWRLTEDYPGAAGALEAALGICRDLGDRLGEANALNELGIVRWLTGDYAAAAGALEAALGICRDLGDRLGEANALYGLGIVWRMTENYPGAARALEAALDIYRDLGNRLGEANALNDLGAVWRMTENYPGAARALEAALDIYRDLGVRGSEVDALNERGMLFRVSGEPARAEECHQQALEMARGIASAWDEAHALAGLGRCAITMGHATQAEILLRQAQEIFQRIGAAEALVILTEVNALTGPAPAG